MKSRQDITDGPHHIFNKWWTFTSREIWKWKAAFYYIQESILLPTPLFFLLKYIHYQRYNALEKLRQLVVLLCKEFKILTEVFTNDDAEMCSTVFPDPPIHLSSADTRAVERHPCQITYVLHTWWDGAPFPAQSCRSWKLKQKSSGPLITDSRGSM